MPALLAVLYGTGLRRSEAVSLQCEDFDPSTGALKVLGKGDKQRLVHVTGGALAALQNWLKHRGNEPGALFNPVLKGGRIQKGPMTDQAVRKTLRSLAQKAGVSSFSPHDLRRTFVSELLDAGADISTVQRMAGHAQVTTTARYDRRDERAQKRAAELLHVPFVAS